MPMVGGSPIDADRTFEKIAPILGAEVARIATGLAQSVEGMVANSDFGRLTADIVYPALAVYYATCLRAARTVVAGEEPEIAGRVKLTASRMDEIVRALEQPEPVSIDEDGLDEFLREMRKTCCHHEVHES